MGPSPLVTQLIAWQKGIGSELSFWEKWFQSQGMLWPDDFRYRQQPDTEIDASLLSGNLSSANTLRILDVGAGPMTVLGKQKNGCSLNITACDPLGPFYAEMAERHGVKRPVPTEQAFAEDLTAFYPRESFDLVFCQNALDHSFDPVRGIEEMLLVVKPIGRVVLRHNINEAETENYFGFHQWNFDEDAGHFVVWNRANRIDITEIFSPWADITTAKGGGFRETGTLSVFFDMKSTPALAIDKRAEARVRELLTALLGASAT